jgi:ribosomal protein L32
MAVPKKRTSKSKKRIRKSNWKQKFVLKANQALAKAKSALKRAASTNVGLSAK